MHAAPDTAEKGLWNAKMSRSSVWKTPNASRPSILLQSSTRGKIAFHIVKEQVHVTGVVQGMLAAGKEALVTQRSVMACRASVDLIHTSASDQCKKYRVITRSKIAGSLVRRLRDTARGAVRVWLAAGKMPQTTRMSAMESQLSADMIAMSVFSLSLQCLTACCLQALR
mmetsp:Transcript_79574/g.190923  ORF Transcript_79574/g.190923 Transcript_79574/m.190923 type:complete len:169 (-) Transcript_79574:526-1032(-)